MKILKRHKNSLGLTIGYTVLDNNEIIYMPQDNLLADIQHVENAKALRNGEIRATKGHNIETVIVEPLKLLADIRKSGKKQSKHTYINPDLVHNFDKAITYDELYDEVQTNVIGIVDDDEESLTYICNALWDDLQTQRANYKAYIEPGITARILMELRKSAMLPMASDLTDFYSLHASCETYKDVHQFRKRYLAFICDNYMDFDWQLYYVLRYSLGTKKNKTLDLNYEYCFDDGIHLPYETLDDYKESWLEQRFPKEKWQEIKDIERNGIPVC